MAQVVKATPKSNSSALAIATIVCILVIFPMLLSTLILWLPFRILVIALVHVFNPELDLVQKGMGTFYAVRSTRGRPDGNMVYHLICQGSFSLDQLRHQFHHQVLEFQDPKGDLIYRRLRYFFRPIFQVVFWQEDVNFDLKNHIRLYDYDQPELALPKDTVTEDDLMRVTGRLVTRPYATGRSPWELLLTPNFKGKNGEDQAAITLRIHHGIADGLSCIGLIHRLFGASVPDPLARFPKLALKDKLFQTIYVTLRAPYELARFAVDFNDEFSGWKLPAESYSDDFVSYCSDPVPWSKIKGIMKKYEVNSNAAVYSIMCGAIVRMMAERGQEVPCKLSAMTSYPIPNHPGGLCNHTSYSGFEFNPYTDVGSALVQKVATQVRATNYLNPLAKVMEVIAAVQSLFPVFVTKSLLVVPSTFIFTHYPGPLRVLHDPKFATLIDIIPAIDSLGGGSIAIAVSTAGNLRIGLTVNKAVLPEQGDRSSTSFDGYVKDEIEAIF